MKTIRALLTFHGRLGRLPFVLAMVAVALFAYSVPLQQLVDMAIHSVDPTYPLDRIPLARDAPNLPGALAAAILVLAAALVIALVWGSLSALARRFHDIGLSAWLVVPAVVLVLLVPNVGPAFLPPLGVLLLIALMGLAPGTRGANRFDAATAAES